MAMAGFALLGACNAEKPGTETAPAADSPTEVAAEPDAVPADSTKVQMETSLGTIVIALNAEKAPITVANFLKYVKAGHYNDTVFHRVIDGFMIQGGGFAMQDAKLVEKPSGEGIKNEGQNGLKNLKGTISMARTNDPDSATAQFFINVADNAALDFPNNGGYAVFGKVVEGMDVVEAIKGVQTGQGDLVMLHPMTGNKMEMAAGDVPFKPVIIKSVKVVE